MQQPMSQGYVPPEECLRRAAEALEKAADHHEEKDVDRRDHELNNALAWFEEGKYEGEFQPLLDQGDLAKQLVDLPPDQVDQIRELYDEGTYSYKDLASNFRCSVTAVQTVIEYPPYDNM